MNHQLIACSDMNQDEFQIPLSKIYFLRVMFSRSMRSLKAYMKTILRYKLVILIKRREGLKGKQLVKGKHLLFHHRFKSESGRTFKLS